MKIHRNQALATSYTSFITWCGWILILSKNEIGYHSNYGKSSRQSSGVKSNHAPPIIAHTWIILSAAQVMAESPPDNELILVRDRYKLIKVLGRGSYGEVWLVTPLESSTGSKAKPRRCVLKRVSVARANDEKSELAAAEREAQLLSSLKHPNIVAYIESFRSRDHHLNIVMAFCEGGDLYTKLKYQKKQLLNEDQILEWFIQITLALQYMHDRSILHRDLKTQNIFLTKQEIVKVGDLGIARILDNNGADLATTVIGTPYVHWWLHREVLHLASHLDTTWVRRSSPINRTVRNQIFGHWAVASTRWQLWNTLSKPATSVPWYWRWSVDKRRRCHRLMLIANNWLNWSTPCSIKMPRIDPQQSRFFNIPTSNSISFFYTRKPENDVNHTLSHR